MKKALTLILALIMVASMAFTAYAADTYSVTINEDAAGHTYEAYQIFTGTLSADGVLSNIQWGSGVSEAGKTALGSAEAQAEALTSTTAAAAFAQTVEQYLTTPAGSASTQTNGAYVISNLAAGYYLIKDMDNSLDGDNDSYTSYILKVVKDTQADPKSSVPTVYKKVKDINDSTETALGSWQDSADHDIGDSVPFQLVATLAGNVTSYESYTITFHDTMCKGLTYDEDVTISVKVGDTVVDPYNASTAPDGYTVSTKVNSDGTTSLDVKINDVKTYGGTNNSIVTVEFNAILNEDANIGSLGNPNVVYLEYSNNPNQVDSDGDGIVDSTEGTDAEEAIDTGATPEDKVIVFTYQTVINKVDQDGNALTGAAFTLEKYNETTKAWETVTEDTNDGSQSVFTFVGIDDGRYRLTETATPSGYNSIDPIYFNVTASHDTEAVSPTLTSLAATQCDANGTNLTTGVVATFTGTPSSGEISTNIQNQKGATLPETGGIGTTIFYVVGGILMLVAVVVLVAKKRVSAED